MRFPLALAALPGLLTAAFLLFAVSPAQAGSSAHPEVLDDSSGEVGVPPEVDVLDGWVGNETASSFSLFMRIQSLAPPDDDSELYQYHFHFQVTRTDENTSLYHAMVHHLASGTWLFMVQRWIPSGGVGAWGDTHNSRGWVDGSAGVIEVVVEKAWILSPKIDVTKNAYAIDSFYIHADIADRPSGATLTTDSAPGAGTMGSYSVSVGAPAGSGSGASPLLVLGGLAAFGVAAVALLAGGRRAGREQP